MKNKYVLLIAFSLLGYMASTGLGLVQGEHQKGDLKLIFKASTDTFILGEPIPLSIELYNLSGKEIGLVNTLDPIYGSLKIYTHNDDNSVHYEYTNPKWGILETGGFLRINANESFTNSTHLLSRIKSYDEAEYFFNLAGTYYLQVSYQVHVIGQKNSVEIKSEPLKITIADPKGEDLVVWNKMREHGNFAYFIQEGEILVPSYKSDERAKFLKEVDQILIDHPNSFYATSLRQSLDKFKANEAKRQEFRQKLQKQKPQ